MVVWTRIEGGRVCRKMDAGYRIARDKETGMTQEKVYGRNGGYGRLESDR